MCRYVITIMSHIALPVNEFRLSAGLDIRRALCQHEMGGPSTPSLPFPLPLEVAP